MRRVAAVAAAVAALAAAVSAQQDLSCPAGQAWDAAAGACAVCDARLGEGVCMPGQAFNATLAACAQCPEGKQSPGGAEPCSYCRFTLRPTEAQDSCECGELYFNMRNATRSDADVGCTPCASVQVARLDGARVGCQTTGAGRTCGKRADGSLESPGSTGSLPGECSISGASQCECVGGPKGEAHLCAQDGYFVKKNLSAVAEEDTLFLLQCIKLRSTHPSRCQHWSRCLGEQANTRSTADDPCAFAFLPTERAAPSTVCPLIPVTSVLRNLTDTDFVDEWEFAMWLNSSSKGVRSCPHGENCCWPGFTGPLCEHCVSPRGNKTVMKIGAACVRWYVRPPCKAILGLV